MSPAAIGPEKIPPMAHVVLLVIVLEESYARGVRTGVEGVKR
jgi:hypothetical protein